METHKEHIDKGFKNLFTVNQVRGHQLLEILEYSLLYAAISWIAAIGIEKLFPEPDDRASTKSIITQILLQCILSAVAVYYIRLTVKIVPYFFETSPEYNPHDVMEYNGEIMIALVFVGTQQNLLKKLEILRVRFF